MLLKDQNPAFFIPGGVKSGVARRFVSDIARWARDYKTTYRSDDIEVRSLQNTDIQLYAYWVINAFHCSYLENFLS